MTHQVYDLLVVGGGMYGACVAWEAASRGLSVALVEKGDFGAATSANSLKIIHGGLRYLQHADFKRMRESIHERSTLMRIAPHLVHPLPILLPTYGFGQQGRMAMMLALALNDLISFDRNQHADRQKYLPRGHTISRRACLDQLPDIDPRGLTGAAIFHDAQVYNSERLVLAFLQSAAAAGAHVANYVEVIGLCRTGKRIQGVTARDAFSGDHLTIQARMVVNTAGPWVRHVDSLAHAQTPASMPYLATAINLITRPLFDTYAVGIASRTTYRDRDSVVARGSRLLFAVPWRDCTMIGTSYVPYTGSPDAFTLAEQDIQAFLDEFNRAYPIARLARDDVRFVHAGLVPITDVDATTGSVRLAKQFQIDDHRQHGIEGLISVVGVKYTTARHVAEQTVDHIFARHNQTGRSSTSAHTPLHGGHIDRFASFQQTAQMHRPHRLTEAQMQQLVYNYGTAYPQVLSYMPPGTLDTTVYSELDLIAAETRYAVHNEMACTLADVVFRRTELGTAGFPGHAPLRHCAAVMGQALGWNEARIQQELHAVYSQASWTLKNERRHATALADPTVQQVGLETTQV